MRLIKTSELPEKIRLCVLDEKSGHPLRGVALQLRIGLQFQGSSETVGLGLLASNHAGYLSFDLKSKKRSLSGVVTSLHAVVPTSPPIEFDLSDKLPSLVVGEGTPAHELRDIVPLSLPAALADIKTASRGLASIQEPDLADWLLSPGSFGADAVPIVGENGCEVLLPSHAPERIVRFHQLVRRPREASTTAELMFQPAPAYGNENPTPDSGWPYRLQYRAGELRHYELVWLPLNHGLGKVLYSLTLAPCEAVRLAVLEWSRTE